MENTGRFLMVGGVLLFLVGGLIFLAARFGLPLGRLFGDIRIQGEGFSFYFPLASSIAVSVVLTVLLNVVVRLIKK